MRVIHKTISRFIDPTDKPSLESLDDEINKYLEDGWNNPSLMTVTQSQFRLHQFLYTITLTKVVYD